MIIILSYPFPFFLYSSFSIHIPLFLISLFYYISSFFKNNFFFLKVFLFYFFPFILSLFFSLFPIRSLSASFLFSIFPFCFFIIPFCFLPVSFFSVFLSIHCFSIYSLFFSSRFLLVSHPIFFLFAICFMSDFHPVSYFLSVPSYCFLSVS